MATTTKKTCIAILALATVFAVRGAEWYVDPVNGLDTLDGTTSNVVSEAVGPRKTLEKAMELVKAGDTLWLLPGEYNEGSMNNNSTRIYVTKSNVKVKSTAGAAKTFIVGAGGTDMASTSSKNCAIVQSGLTGVIFEGITFKNGCGQRGTGTNVNGGGLSDQSESAWAVDCVFTNCYAYMGGGMYFGNALRCHFVDCSAGYIGGAVARGNKFAFCLFDGCSTSDITTFYPWGSGNKFYNCTFYGNIGNAFSQDSWKHSVLNSIIVGYAKNGSAGMYATNCVMGTASCADTFNCVTGVSVASSGLVAPDVGDFRVNESSAAASLGDASLLADFPAPAGYSLDWDLAGNPVPSSGPIPAGCIVEIRSCHKYVDCVNGDDANDGTESNPYKTIRAATIAAMRGDVIHVAPGTYGAAEGSQLTSEAVKIGTRVVIPEGVTVESTGGAKETFIVGALATGDQIDNETYGTGTNAVRCVYANDGAMLRGFTLTGGRTIGVAGDDNVGSAFYSATARGATVEDCIISNNVAYSATICKAVVRRCRVIGNTCTIANNGPSGSAGDSCSWYNCIIANNLGNATVFLAKTFESCTLGAGNTFLDGSYSAQVLFWNDGKDHAVKNCAVLYGRYYCTSPGKICLTNCLIATSVGSDIDVERSYNTIFTNSAAAQVDSEYRPILGSFLGIDAGDAAYSTEALGDTDIYGTPRILNGAIDMGAVEYDWRPTFAHEIGRRFNMTYASPSVTTNAMGGLLLGAGVGFVETALPSIAGTVGIAGSYEFAFEMTGGSAQVYVGGVLVGEASGTGEKSIKFNVANTSDEIRFVYTPEAGSMAILKKLASMRGFVISFR